jgi:hypothetical protein
LLKMMWHAHFAPIVIQWLSEHVSFIYKVGHGHFLYSIYPLDARWLKKDSIVIFQWT